MYKQKYLVVGSILMETENILLLFNSIYLPLAIISSIIVLIAFLKASRRKIVKLPIYVCWNKILNKEFLSKNATMLNEKIDKNPNYINEIFKFDQKDFIIENIKTISEINFDIQKNDTIWKRERSRQRSAPIDDFTFLKDYSFRITYLDPECENKFKSFIVSSKGITQSEIIKIHKKLKLLIKQRKIDFTL